MRKGGEKTHESTKPMDVPSRHIQILNQVAIYDHNGGREANALNSED